MVYRPDAAVWHARAAKMRARGERTSEIAAELGQSPAAVCNALRRLAEKAAASTNAKGSGRQPEASPALSCSVARGRLHTRNVKELPT